MSIDLATRLVSGDTSIDVLDWVRAGLARHLKGDALDCALALDRGSLLRERNRALMSAAAMLEADGTWAAAGRLANAIKRFESRVLPICRRGGAVSLSPLDEQLAALFATRQRFPRTPRKLYDFLLLTKNPG